MLDLETFDKAVKESKKQDKEVEQNFETDFDKEKAKNINSLVKKKPKKDEPVMRAQSKNENNVNGTNSLSKEINRDSLRDCLIFEKRTREEADNFKSENNKENTHSIDTIDKVIKD